MSLPHNSQRQPSHPPLGASVDADDYDDDALLALELSLIGCFVAVCKEEKKMLGIYDLTRLCIDSLTFLTQSSICCAISSCVL
jgi:hypothetical protein